MPDNVLWRLNGYDTRMRLYGHRVKYGLDNFLDHFFGTIFLGPFFWDHFFGPFFLDHFFYYCFWDHIYWTILYGGKYTISTKGGVGCSLLVPRGGGSWSTNI